MTALSINLNKIALIRNSREGNYPSVVEHAMTCIDCGVDGITVHPRPDQRHIRPDDVRQLAALTRSLDEVEFNIEGNPFADAQGSYPGLIALVEETQPDQCTLVPDADNQLTSDHGFDLTKQADALLPIIDQIKAMGVRVSLFMDPDLRQIKLASEVGADRIELYTGPYAAAWGSNQLESLFQQHLEAANLATSLGMGVNAGHDLNLDNLEKFASIPDLLEVSIGHAFTVDSLNMGMVSALRAYQTCLS
jgi:pyridoxine 5-phosphate synthase